MRRVDRMVLRSRSGRANRISALESGLGLQTSPLAVNRRIVLTRRRIAASPPERFVTPALHRPLKIRKGTYHGRIGSRTYA